MPYTKKALAEKEFVDYILSTGGIEKHIESVEGRNSYYKFFLNNGEIRFWTNISDENLKRLGTEGGK